MALPLPPFNPYQPIPNDPFYSPQTFYIQGAEGALIVGSGLAVNYATGTLNATGGGGTGSVTSITAGAGLTGGTITTSGTIAMPNVGPGAVSFTNANITLDAQGRVTAASNGTAISSVVAGTGITVNTVGGAATVALNDTGVAAGSYTNANITVDAQGRITTAANGSPGGVTSVSVTNPITNSGTATAPNIGLANTSVTPGSYTLADITVDAQGRLTSATSGSAVTSVTAGTGLTGGVITSSGTINLANTAVSAGSYIYGSFTVDQQGRLTAASSGTAPNTTVTSPIVNAGTAIAPVIGVLDASTISKGVVQLADTLASVSETEALTAKQGNILQTQINTLAVAGSLVLAGTFNASTSQMLTVTSDGTAAGFTVGSNLPAAAGGNTDFFVIVTTGGSYSPPGGGGPYSVSQGDWLLSTGTTWQYLNVGYDPAPASDSVAGVIRVATLAEVANGLDNTVAISPLGGEATYLKKSLFTGAGVLLTATGSNTPVALGIGSNGNVLTVDTTCIATGGLKWATPSAAGIPCACLTAAGQLITTQTGSIGTPVALPVGANNTVLTACSTAASGLCWAPVPAAGIPCACLTAKGTLITAGTTAGIPVALPVGASDGLVLTVCSSESTGLCWASIPAAGIPCTCLTAAGQIITTQTGSLGTPFALPVGANGTILTACSAATSGLCWVAPPAPAIPCATITAKSELIVGTGASTFATLAPTANDQLLVADSACATGLKWAANTFVDDAAFTGKGSILAGCTTAGTYCALSLGTDGQFLVADSACGNGIKWSTECFVNDATYTAKGDLVAGTAAGTYAALSVTASPNGQFLVSDSACTTGLKWVSGFTNKGDVLVGTGSTAFSVLPVGTNGQYLVPNSSCPSGLEWVDGNPLVVFGYTCGATPFNTGFGCNAGGNISGGACNTALGFSAGAGISTGNANVALGACAGCNITTGCFNVAIGSCAQVASATGNCQLAIGFNSTSNWLTGDSSLNITPGGNIIDCAGVQGAAGAVLTSVGPASNKLRWVTYTGAWIDGGAVTLTASTTSPSFVAATSKVYYRQIGPKTYQVLYRLFKNAGVAATGGNGDYLFQLPAGLQFDTTVPFQATYTGNLSTSDFGFTQYMLPGPSVGHVYAPFFFSPISQPSVYSSTQFRVIAYGITATPGPPAVVTQQLAPLNPFWFAPNTAQPWQLQMQFEFVAA